MVQAEAAGAVGMVALVGASAAPTLAEVEKIVDGIVVRRLVERFGSEDAVRRFAHVRTESGRVVVSAGIEHEAVDLARVVIAELRGHGIEATVRQNPNPWIAPSQRGVFHAPSATSARRFAIHLDLSPAPSA